MSVLNSLEATNQIYQIFEMKFNIRYKFWTIKQFVISNCRKERAGSIVTETLKNGILIPIVTSKESNLNADFKYNEIFHEGAQDFLEFF